ncbi:hypothetical protein B0J14DRAFT_557341 [Halenospora varia]|nr:hypothetical protein B0J14DRAFT_557341 [Halenospora varia]
MASFTSSNTADFSTDQAELLRDLAFGGYHDASFNSRHNAYSNEQSLGTNFDDIADSAVLLEGLSNYHPSTTSGNENNFEQQLNPGGSNDTIASLLEAAATADGERTQDASQANHTQPPQQPHQSHQNQQLQSLHGSPSSRNTVTPVIENKTPPPNASSPSKRKRSDNLGFIKNSKRQRKVIDQDERQIALQREIWDASPDEEEYKSEGERLRWQDEEPEVDARAMGLHSAVALYRKPSAASQKYTRAPMSKLLTSLELSAQEFVKLQSAAKTYMLAPDHPERRDCIASKLKGDNDMIKLKLFSTVEHFLEIEGWGERCYGKHSMGADKRKLQWPLHRNKIIPLVTPLLRRMVTNERQRQYAETKRKIEPVEKRGRSKKNQEEAGSPGSTILDGDIDPALTDYQYTFDSRSDVQPSVEKQTKFTYQLNYVEGDGKRLIGPRVSLASKGILEFMSVVERAQLSLESNTKKISLIKVLGPDGQVDVCTDASWERAMTAIKEHEWMDGRVTCIVYVEDLPVPVNASEAADPQEKP